MRYVALVATHPKAQRKGYAEAAMRDVLERSLAAGLDRRTYLHATAAGRPVYERMGYKVIPSCPFVRRWLQDHPERRPVVSGQSPEGVV